MKNTNGNLPAMPQTHSDNLCQQTGTAKAEHAGLTKREMFAMAAMQGLLVNMGRNGLDSIKQVAEHASAAADELLAELERQA
jgi:hypothetical protein